MELIGTETRCLHHIFESQVDTFSGGVALIHEGQYITYYELECWANQLAHYLHSCAIGPGKFVGLCLERSINHIVAILGILKSGATYVPIDTNFPEERIRHIVTDAGIALLVTEYALTSKLSPVFSGTHICLDSEAEAIKQQPITRLPSAEIEVTPHDLCYVIYTSGTTGRPKGVMTEHRNVVRFVDSFNEVIKLNSRDRIYHGFSLGFDGSVEEMWMAFSNGAALVLGTREVVRFGNEVSRLINEKKVTVLSTVPTFLTMIDQDLPTVRLLIVSGEQCSPELVNTWAQSHRIMLNVYGPTETTVNTTVEHCLPGKPIAIGKPIRGYNTYILNEEMKRVKSGEAGELFIGGVGVARGYLNQRELTQRQFITNPFNGSNGSSKLYRTGDLVRQTSSGDLVFLGRIDNQVKVRGFRVELSEIETLLQEHTLIRQAVVTAVNRNGIQELAAYVVSQETEKNFDRTSVLTFLRSRLPYYMIPSYLDILDKLPTLASGKVDRNQLPKLYTPLIRQDKKTVSPSSPLEQKLVGIWEKILQITPISTTDDFFMDLGGHSLLAAQMISLIRNQGHRNIAIRDVYTYPTIQKLAGYLTSTEKNARSQDRQNEDVKSQGSSKAVFAGLSPLIRKTCASLQALSLYWYYGLGILPFVVLYLLFQGVTKGDLPLPLAIGISLAFSVGLFPSLLILSIIAKWLIIGRFKPGIYPLWGFYYFRWWLVSRLQMLSGAGFLEGTPLMSLYYRLMGAKVGKNCLLDTSNCSAFDLVTIGNNTSIGADTNISGYKIEKGNLVLGTIMIGSDVFIGMHSHLGLNSQVEDQALLDDLSHLPENEILPVGESRRGSPAVPAKVKVPDTSAHEQQKRQPVLYSFYHILAIYSMELFLLITALPSLVLLYSAYTINNLYYWLGIAGASILVFELCFCLFLGLVKRLVLPQTKPGVYATQSFFYVRKWFIDNLMNLSRLLILPIYTTVYFPPWLRYLGAKLGPRNEFSIVGVTAPDLLETESESFFADGSVIGGNRFYRGCVHIAPNKVGNRSFIGNNALVPNGTEIGDQCLIGVLSVPPVEKDKTPDKSEWLGSPAFQLPHHQKVEGFTEEQTYKPTKKLIFLRYMIDSMRILIPSIMEILGLVILFLLLHLVHSFGSLPLTIILAPCIGLGISLAMALGVVVVKIMLMGVFRPIIKPLWSPYVWLNEVINGAYESIGAPLLSPLLGTPFFNWYLRLLGCKIGKHVFINTTLFGEFDLVEIGDYASLSNGVVVQNHLFEDRIFKASHLKIGDQCSVGSMSVVLYDTEMQTGSTIGPLSLLMKGETLPPFTHWQGIPTAQND